MPLLTNFPLVLFYMQAQLLNCIWPCNPMDCKCTWLLFQHSSRGSSQPRNQTRISCGFGISRQNFYHWAIWEAPFLLHRRTTDWEQQIKGKFRKACSLHWNISSKIESRKWHSFLTVMYKNKFQFYMTL